MESTTLYGVATWTIFKVNRKKIDAFLNTMLEKIVEHHMNKIRNKSVYL